MQMYVEDYDERMPPTARWEETLAPHVKAAAQSDEVKADGPFVCPSASTPASYGLNAILDRRLLTDLDSSAETVALFDADAPRHSFTGGDQDLARERHSHAPVVVFADGHAKQANSYVVGKLNWSPTMAPEPQK